MLQKGGCYIMPSALLYEAAACFGRVIKTWRLSCMLFLRVLQRDSGRARARVSQRT